MTKIWTTLASLVLCAQAPVAVSDTVAEALLRTQTIELRDGRGRPLSGSAVIVVGDYPAAPATPAQPAVMSQKNERFTPDLLVIQAGEAVAFPNNDRVMHHVYSFSQARQFEIPLYQSEAPSPIRFETAGVVVVGCNIHDQMVGTIIVADTPFFALTDKRGRARLTVPPGATEVDVWYPRDGRYVSTRRRLADAATAGGKRGARTVFEIADASQPQQQQSVGALEWNEDY
ncbi:MAG: methylamine utilization protein [Pseudomonadota bacterium]